MTYRKIYQNFSIFFFSTFLSTIEGNYLSAYNIMYRIFS